MKSPLLSLPGAVAAEGRDEGVAAHYGDLFREQRALADGVGFVDLSHRGVVTVTGDDRLAWLHLLLTQHVTDLPAGSIAEVPEGAAVRETPHGRDLFLPRADLESFAASHGPAAGILAYEALRVEAHRPRLGFVTTAVRHHELGPIALALVKRNVPVDAPLIAGTTAAAQETVVEP